MLSVTDFSIIVFVLNICFVPFSKSLARTVMTPLVLSFVVTLSAFLYDIYWVTGYVDPFAPLGAIFGFLLWALIGLPVHLVYYRFRKQ